MLCFSFSFNMNVQSVQSIELPCYKMCSSYSSISVTVTLSCKHWLHCFLTTLKQTMLPKLNSFLLCSTQFSNPNMKITPHRS